MKKIFFLLIVALDGLGSFSQGVAINNNNTPADASSMLDISSHDKGVLIPRMRTNERTAIVNPAYGLLVYDVDTRSFWYYDTGSWKEILNSTVSILPTGLAGGDLSGTYPSPSVGKIQNLDVAFGVPFDKQVMKWDGLNNKWQGLNDSLFLPYNVTFGSSTKLFGITNANTTNGATAVYGKSGNSGSGIAPAITIGVWGDNSTGAGVVGTSSNGVGTYGYSVNNYGAYGFTSGANFAGVYGTRINNGPAVMGDIYSAGIGIFGKSNGTTGKAAWFENTSISNTDTVAKFINNGTGVNSYFINPNVNNTGALINGEHFGDGSGIRMKLWNVQNNNPGIYIYQYGNGDGIYVGSNKSKSANFYSNAGNTDTTVAVIHDGTGKGLQVNLNNVANSNEALNTTTAGTGSAAKFIINNSTNNSPAVSVTTNGTGRGLQSTISNSSNLAAALYGSSSGNKGVEGIALNLGVTGQSTALTGGIGVFGQSSLNSADGIGLKGISYSTSISSGAVTGMNLGNGVAIYGEASGTNGIGVFGITNTGIVGVYGETSAANSNGVYGISSGNESVAIFGDAGQNNSLSHAAEFRNVNATNYKDVVTISNSGTGDDLYIANYNASNANPMIHARNDGGGSFILMEDGNAIDKFLVTKSGNITTAGTLTVKGDKGIVRNSSGTQLRIEVLPATYTMAGGSILTPLDTRTVSVTFGTAFSAAPTVYVANITVDGNASLFITVIKNVTTSGCDLVIRNIYHQDATLFTSSWKIVAVGAE